FCETSNCVRHQDKWAIHGAWPENNDGTYPQSCCTKQPFNQNVLKPIESELIAHWSTLKVGCYLINKVFSECDHVQYIRQTSQVGGSNSEFWSHEYSKHGTCAVESPLMKVCIIDALHPIYKNKNWIIDHRTVLG